MAAIQRFEEIKAWQTARQLSRLVYTLSGRNAFARDFGLRDQIRRASVSILSNIAEGFESQTRILFISYLHRAKGSAAELRAQSYVALDAGYIEPRDFDRIQKMSDTCGRQLRRFIDYLRQCHDR